MDINGSQHRVQPNQQIVGQHLNPSYQMILQLLVDLDKTLIENTDLKKNQQLLMDQLKVYELENKDMKENLNEFKSKCNEIVTKTKDGTIDKVTVSNISKDKEI